MAFACYAIFHILPVLILLPFLAIAQTNGTFPIGMSLTANDEVPSWLSPSGDFAFGFHQLDNKDQFLLSIWYAKIPDKTIVWYANGDNPAPRGSKVELTADGGLVLNDPQGKEIWRSEPIIGSVAYGVMNDTGNFVLESSNSNKLWQSFDYPTDTMLPTQTMMRGGVLSSRKSATNFSTGRFQFRLLNDGNLVLNTINLDTKFAYDAYYISDTYDGSNSSNSGYQVIFNESGYMYILIQNGQRSPLTPGKTVPATDFYHRATLDFDGVFAQYYHPKMSSNNGNWSVVWSEPENICVKIVGGVGSGACGYNSICKLNEYGRPICKCPLGFSLLDPNDEYGSCIRDFNESCEEDEDSVEDLYDFLMLIDTDWPSSDYEELKPFNEEECKKSCLHDCMCATAIHRGDSCWKKKLPLSNGRVDSSVNGKAFIKFRKGTVPSQNPPHSNPFPKKDKKGNSLAGSVLLGSSVSINFVFLSAFCVGFYFIYHKKLKKIHQAESATESNLRSFTYEELAKATNDFEEEVGRGSFGIVYKGELNMVSTNVVAVKKLDRVVEKREKEFRTEVDVIGQTHHKNLVQLIGFCDEGQHRLLVYKFMSNGTLASFLFGGSTPSWNIRTQIAVGIARGLLYLHEECGTQIIHCDIKPENVLLDDYYNARISDFGLAKLLMMDQSQTLTTIRGTRGYVAPEWFRSTPITLKVDVYSFGVLLLEIICCRRCVDAEMHMGEIAVLTDWACDCYQGGTLNALVEDDMEAMNDIMNLERFVKLAIWCIQEDPSLRPTMRKVTQMLEGVLEVTAPPNPYPSFSISTTG
jgi:hypothetical protein